MKPCTLSVGCEESGVCYASAHGHPEQCGVSSDWPDWPATEPSHGALFNAIAAATKLEWGGTAIGVSVKAFLESLAASQANAGNNNDNNELLDMDKQS